MASDPIGGVLTISAAYMLARPVGITAEDLAIAAVGIAWSLLIIAVGVLHKGKGRLVHFIVPLATTALLFAIYQYRMSRHLLTAIQYIYP